MVQTMGRWKMVQSFETTTVDPYVYMLEVLYRWLKYVENRQV